MILQKLDILKESGMIDAEVYDFTRAAMDCLRAAGIDVENHAPVDPFLTHLAMAAARQKNDEPPIAQMDALICAEIERDAKFPQAKALWETLMTVSPVTFREEELHYCYLHICAMLQ